MSGGPEFDLGAYSFIPDNIKVKKVLRLRPLPLELGASLVYNIERKEFTYKVNCKETILGGKVTLDVHQRAIEYRKRLSLPVIRLNCLVVGARAALDPETHRLHTSCRLGFELRQGTAEITRMNTLRIKPQLFFKRIGLEAVTDISVQVPKQLFFELPSDFKRFPNLRGTFSRKEGHHHHHRHSDLHHGAGIDRMSDGEGEQEQEYDAWGISLDMREINLIIRL